MFGFGTSRYLFLTGRLTSGLSFVLKLYEVTQNRGSGIIEICYGDNNNYVNP